MTSQPISRATHLLRRLKGGDQAAGHELFSLIYGELRQIAGRFMEGERDSHTLQATALIHEAFLKIVGSSSQAEWESRAHLLRAAARAMRYVLVDHARTRKRDKRGKGSPGVPLDEALMSLEGDSLDILSLNDALDRLSEIDAQLAKIVELRFFGGLTASETARVLGTSLRSVERGWFFARAWLKKEIHGEG